MIETTVVSTISVSTWFEELVSVKMPQEVTLERREEHVAFVTINRPEARNAVNSAVANGLEKVLLEIERDNDLRVAVLTGAGGKVFCAGADLKEVSQGRLDTLSTSAGGFGGFVNAERTKPWIAAVEGLALAGGCELALACDIIIASEDGAFGLPEVTRGLVAAAGGLYRLPRALPKSVAIDHILTAERLSARRAAALGMVSRLAPAGKVVEMVLEVARIITCNAPLAVRESLTIARLANDLTEADLHCLSKDAQARLQKTADFYEGATAFVEKRLPVWKGA